MALSLETIKKELRSILLACPHGVNGVRQLDREYRNIVGQPLPYRSIGFSDLESMVRSMPDVMTSRKGSDGEWVIRGVADESTQHIANLVAKQRVYNIAFSAVWNSCILTVYCNLLIEYLRDIWL